MKKLSLLAVSASAALICAAVPLSCHWSPATAPSVAVDRAEARVGRPLTATSVAGVSRRADRRAYRRAAAGVAVGAAAVGGAAYYGGYYGPGAVGAARAYYGGYYEPGPAVAAAAYGGPGYGYGYGYGYGPGPDPDSVIVNPLTGRWCRTEPNGYQWCWTP